MLSIKKIYLYILYFIALKSEIPCEKDFHRLLPLQGKGLNAKKDTAGSPFSKV
jgi:hypothetical protein